MNEVSKPAPAADPPLAKKAGLRQVAATVFWGLMMVGKKGTWERDGATVTLRQVVLGAAVMTVLVIALLLLLVRFAIA